MLIKLLYGTCGAREGDIIVSKTSKSAPFEVEEKRGKQLIAMGYAVGYSQGQKAEVKAGEKADDPEEEAVKSLEEYSIQDLKKMAKEMKLSASGNKQQLINRIQAAGAEGKADEEDLDKPEEEPPALTPAEPEV